MSDPSLRGFRIFVVAVCAVLVGFVTLSSLRVLPHELRFNVGQVFPEGWDLFTRDPRLPVFRSAVQRNGTWVRADRGPLSKASNWFGFSRTARWQSVEVERLVEEVPDLSAWTPCDRAPSECLEDIDEERVATVRNRTPFTSLCGRVALVRQFVVPWDEAQPGGNDFRTTHVIVLEAQC